jgi:hypothetical protein
MSHACKPLILPSERSPADTPAPAEAVPLKDFDALAARLHGRMAYADEATAAPVGAAESKLHVPVLAAATC